MKLDFFELEELNIFGIHFRSPHITYLAAHSVKGPIGKQLYSIQTFLMQQSLHKGSTVLLYPVPKYRLQLGLGVLFLLLLSFTLQAQNKAISTGPRLILSGMANWTNPLEISRSYQGDGNFNDISSEASPGYEGRFTFLQPIKNNFTIQGSFGFGVYSHKLILKLSDDFRYLGWGGFDDYFTEYDLIYLGYTLGVGYIKPLTHRSRLDIRLNGQMIYFVRQGANYGVSAIPDDNINRNLYLSSTVVNPERKVIIAPELQLIYCFRLSKAIDLEIGFTGTWSNQTVFQTDEGYSVIGDQEVLTGSFEKKYGHIGASLGIAYSLSNNPPLMKKVKVLEEKTTEEEKN